MKFSAVLFAVAVSAVAAELHTNSEIGQRLLSKARQLENRNNNYNSYWIKDYSIKFDGCASIPEFGRDEGVRNNILAKFKLCPSNKCGMCPNAGEYVIDMRDFVESYQEAKQQANEAKCESASYTCEQSCQNGNYAYTAAGDDFNGDENEWCAYQCLYKQGLGYCAQDQNQQNEVNMNELAECKALNGNGNKNNENNGENTQIYYVGVHCTSKGVYAGVFTDSACSKKAPSGTYETYSNGASLPTEALVSYDCISCMNTQNNNNNNNDGNYVSETCQDLYQDASKCERKVKGTSYQDNSSCELIHKIIPKLNASMSRSSGAAAKAFAWIFGIMIVFMGWYIFRLHKLLKRPTGVSNEELIAA